MVTQYDCTCLLCGKLAVHTHHLVFGRGIRQLADEDGLTAPLCALCHDTIHKTPKFGVMSKIIGQMEYEKQAILDGKTEEEARESFRDRYGRSWL